MEMERINDDTFLLRIENQDLIDRGTSIPELLGNPGEIEGFFHSILEEMGVLNQFEDSDGLSFQIMPNPDGLELYVTRIVDMGDESTDERMVRNIVDTIQHSLTDRIGKKRKEDKEEGKISPKPVINTEDKSSTLKPIDVTVVFEDFEDFVSMAKETAGEFDQSVLYRYSGHYFLHVFHQVEKPEEVAAKMALVREYAEFSRISWEVLKEYGEVIMPEAALETGKQYFSVVRTICSQTTFCRTRQLR